MIRECLVKLSRREPLTEKEAYECVLEILEGKATPAQIGSYLAFLNLKVESLDEVLGSVRAMRDKMTRVDADGLDAIDVCGTGGDHHGTFNISTCASLVLAGGGVVVAKHGNRAASSQCGSAEVLDTLGVKIDPAPYIAQRCLQEAKIAFLFAPHFHPAMKNVGPLRKEVGFRTLFNILGPMSNPASVKRQVIGVFDLEKARLMAEVLVRAGSEKVVTLHSQEGLDEVSCAGPTTLFTAEKSAVSGVTIQETMVNPETFGFQRHSLQSLKGSDAAENAKIVTAVLEGEKGPRREAVVMNAAVGFYVSGKASTLPEGAKRAEESIDSKGALQALEALKRISHQ